MEVDDIWQKMLGGEEYDATHSGLRINHFTGGINWE